MTHVRIRLTGATRKELEDLLCQAFKAGDLTLVKRVTALLGIARGEPVDVVAASVGVSAATMYAWLQAFLAEGVAGLYVQWTGGRPKKLTPTQQHRLVAIVRAGPEAAGFPTGCWHALLIQQVIAREFGVTYNVHSLADLLHHLGFSFQKARFVSDHLDEVARATRLTSTGPAWRQQAAAGGLLLFGDEASFAQWGSLGYTSAPVGQQPVVKTTGRRKAYKVFGLIDCFSGRLFARGIDGKFTAASYIAFLTWVLEQTTEPLFLVQDGAPDHRAAAVKACFAAHADRLHVTQLPSYSPDYNPIEFLWRATKRLATHNPLFPRVRRPDWLGGGGAGALRRTSEAGQGPLPPLPRRAGRVHRCDPAGRRLSTLREVMHGISTPPPDTEPARWCVELPSGCLVQNVF